MRSDNAPPLIRVRNDKPGMDAHLDFYYRGAVLQGKCRHLAVSNRLNMLACVCDHVTLRRAISIYGIGSDGQFALQRVIGHSDPAHPLHFYTENEVYEDERDDDATTLVCFADKWQTPSLLVTQAIKMCVAQIDVLTGEHVRDREMPSRPRGVAACETMFAVTHWDHWACACQSFITLFNQSGEILWSRKSPLLDATEGTSLVWPDCIKFSRNGAHVRVVDGKTVFTFRCTDGTGRMIPLRTRVGDVEDLGQGMWLASCHKGLLTVLEEDDRLTVHDLPQEYLYGRVEALCIHDDTKTLFVVCGGSGSVIAFDLRYNPLSVTCITQGPN